MYLWNIDRLIARLKANNLSKHTVRLFYIISPMLSIFNSIFFGALLCSHQVISNFFAHFLEKPHPDMNLFNQLALASGITTTLITCIGLYLCYRTNNAGDGKDFKERMACLSFPINFHITVYILAMISITSLVIYLIMNGKIILFKNEILSLSKKDPSIGQALQEALHKTPLKPLVSEIKRSRGFLGKILGAPMTILRLPTIPGKINAFFKTIRATLLLGYPVLCALPPLMALCHYLILRRMIRKVSS